MVEMIESANILNNAKERSLVILDEVGRGTSTYDGLAIAWAMTEYLAAVGAKTMFATHYHQLNALAGQVSGIANYRVNVEEYEDQVIWTHKVLPGGTDRSYGIHVARMAGVPQKVLHRASEVLREFEQTETNSKPEPRQPKVQSLQLTLFESEEHALVKALRELDLTNITPINALKLLDSLKTKYVK
jgi:DNA mismatch repair protein MutS